MKKLLLLLFISLLGSCGICNHEEEPLVSEYKIIEMSRDELKTSIAVLEARDVINAGKIYIKDDYIFINEKNEGFHIYDNSDQTSPVKVKFLNIPGATDIAVRDNILYINQATDLVTLTFNNVELSVLETGREVSVFTPKKYDPNGVYIEASENKIITNFIKKN